MKRTSLFLFLAVISLSGMAQVRVGKLQKLKATENKGLYHPVFSPRGDFLLFTTASYRGLMFYDLASEQMQEISQADNAGYEVKISDGGKVIVFRQVEYIDNRRYVSLQWYNRENGQTRTLRPASRLKYSFDFDAGRIRVANRQELFTKRLLTDLHPGADTTYMVAIEDMDMVLYVNNVRYVLNPAGKGSYLWPSVSPDGKHILCFATHKMCAYVCDINGKNLVSLGYVNAPQWLGNDYIVGMKDVSADGENYSRSSLMFVRRDGQYPLEYEVPGHPIVLYPAPSHQGDKVAFEADGSIYVLPIETGK